MPSYFIHTVLVIPLTLDSLLLCSTAVGTPIHYLLELYYSHVHLLIQVFICYHLFQMIWSAHWARLITMFALL